MRLTILLRYCSVYVLQVYQISWCEIGDYSYCWHTNSTNSTGNATQFMTQVLAGYTYTFYVQAYTAYGKGRASSIQVIVPPLSLMVWNCRGTRTGGNHGLEVSLTWRPPWSARPGDKIVSACFVLCFRFWFLWFWIIIIIVYHY